MIEERDQGIREVQEQIGQANEIFRDLAVLVHEQGVIIGKILKKRWFGFLDKMFFLSIDHLSLSICFLLDDLLWQMTFNQTLITLRLPSHKLKFSYLRPPKVLNLNAHG